MTGQLQHINAPKADEGLHGDLPSIGFSAVDTRRRARWVDARFGLFIHWGLSAIPGGRWKGREIGGLAEWIQFKDRIPLAEYSELASDFTAENFDAREWVRMAADAGAKYLVFTAKHHDGFAMYRSAASAYNICDATPFGRDPLAELAEACREFGIMLGLYYSQTIDWEDPDAVGVQGNDWDFDPAQGDFHAYWRRKAMPQLRELLGNYGDIGLLWFDMPKGMPEDCAREAADLVRELQPGAVINSRLGAGGYADYLSMDDNYFNNALPDGDWETAATTSDTWGYSALSCDWKPAPALCQALAYSVSRGGNYLLNIGPDASGAIPVEAAGQFRDIGAWMQSAADGIHGASSSPFGQSFGWGHVTKKGTSLFLHVFDPGATEIALPAIQANLVTAYDVCSGRDLTDGAVDGGHGPGTLVVPLDPPQGALPRTVRLGFDADPTAPAGILQMPGQALQLDIWRATAENGTDTSWEFSIQDPGRYRVVLLSKETFSGSSPQWWGEGMTGQVVVAGTEYPFVLAKDGVEDYPVIHFWKLVRSEVCHIDITSPGPQSLSLRDLRIVDSKWDESGVNLVAARLEPIG